MALRLVWEAEQTNTLQDTLQMVQRERAGGDIGLFFDRNFSRGMGHKSLFLKHFLQVGRGRITTQI